METKTDWQMDEVVEPSDMNRIEGNIKALSEKAAGGIPPANMVKFNAAA